MVSIREPKEPDGQKPWPERVTIQDRRVTTAFRVRYAETDQMGMAYYANYLVWFEVMRGDYMRAVDVPYTDLEKDGTILPIIEAHVRYISPARYDDPVEVTAWIYRLRSRMITFHYQVQTQGRLLATGWTTHCPAGLDGKPRAFSRELLNRLRPYIIEE